LGIPSIQWESHQYGGNRMNKVGISWREYDKLTLAIHKDTIKLKLPCERN
jgi:hypothetical protein